MEHAKVKNYTDLCNSIIRPQREEYSIEDLGPKEFSIKDRKYKRKDVGLLNFKGEYLSCSHFEPVIEERVNKLLPCVVFWHGNCGSCLDVLPIVTALLPLNITVFWFDFAGSGRSEGKYVSLGWFEKEDLEWVMLYLRSQTSVSIIGLWGQSMGAVTWLRYAATDPSIAGMVIDSPFSNLRTLWEDLWRKHSRIPLFIWKIIMRFIRRSILKMAKFDIYKLNIVQSAIKWFSPWKFFYPTNDDFVDPSHWKKLHEVYAGDKSITGFEGNHNSTRPQFFYDSCAIFFSENVLMWDSILKVSSKPNIHRSQEEDKPVDKLPEFENTKLRNLDDVLKDRNSEGLIKLDEKVNSHMNRCRNIESQKLIEYEDNEIKLATVRSITTVTEERERDQSVIDFFNKIGRFRDLPSYILEIYEAEEIENKSKWKQITDMNRYKDLVEDAINEFLVGNISEEEIKSIRIMLFQEESEFDTQSETVS